MKLICIKSSFLTAILFDVNHKGKRYVCKYLYFIEFAFLTFQLSLGVPLARKSIRWMFLKRYI